jgi:hypothetical protein
MTFSNDLFFAILSMDSYDRGGSAGINVGTGAIGNATGVLMSRLVFLSIAIVLSLLPVVAPAAPAHRLAPRWHGYGFLPGYHQPPNNSLPAYAQRASLSRMARHNRRPWYIDPIPSYYGYDGDWHYFGRPGFYGGRYSGGSFGPCWTRTPIGPIWNCG